MAKVIRKDTLKVGNIFIDINILEVEESNRFPTGYKYGLNARIFHKDKWVILARIDNSTHDIKKTGQHLHRLDYGIKNTNFNINFEGFEEMIKYLIKIAKEVKSKIK